MSSMVKMWVGGLVGRQNDPTSPNPVMAQAIRNYADFVERYGLRAYTAVEENGLHPLKIQVVIDSNFP